MNLSSIGTSAHQRPDPAELFKKADTDNSGGISKDELATMIQNGPKGPDGGPSVDEIFSQADTDGDGQISEAENKTFLESMDKKGGARAPASLSGSSSKFDELIKALKDSLKSSDTSTDGSSASADGTSGSSTISKDELAKLLQQVIDQLKQDGNQTNLFSAKA